MHLLILADDLTGAADCAARCRGAGLPAVIHIGSPRPALAPGVAAFTTDSRHLAPGVAGRAVAQALADLPAPSHAIWYKKIDSTLRGNLGAELEAWLATMGAPCALICPAFPAQGRALVAGRLVLHGAPQPAELPAMLAAQTQLGVMQVKLADVRAGGSASRGGWRRSARREAACSWSTARRTPISPPCSLRRSRRCRARCCAGVRGWPAWWHSGWQFGIPICVTPPELATPATGPVLAIIGSATALSWRQISAVRAAGIARIVEVGAADQLRARLLR